MISSNEDNMTEKLVNLDIRIVETEPLVFLMLKITVLRLPFKKSLNK